MVPTSSCQVTELCLRKYEDNQRRLALEPHYRPIPRRIQSMGSDWPQRVKLTWLLPENRIRNHLHCPGSHLFGIEKFLVIFFRSISKCLLRQKFYGWLVTSQTRDVKRRQKETKLEGVTYSLLNSFLLPSRHAQVEADENSACADVTVPLICECR